jgi:dipeptidyl aminopeptidase/acylaminoacyl peptidase
MKNAVPENSSVEIKTCYLRAQAFMQGLRTQSLVQNDKIEPHWIEGTSCFWYQSYSKMADKVEKHYCLVDAQAQTNQPAFDHDVLAQRLSEATKQPINAADLPITEITFSLLPLTIMFTALDRRWHFDVEAKTCVDIQPDIAGTLAIGERLSPDSQKIAFIRDNNLWLRVVATDEEYALTNDGEAFNCYAAGPSSVGHVSPSKLNAVWSGDSQRLFTLQRDTRKVKTTPLVTHLPEDGTFRPTVEHVKVAYQGDEHVETYRLVVIDAASGAVCPVDYPPLQAGSSEFGFFTLSRMGWWSTDNQQGYFIDYQGDYRCARVLAFDAETGATRTLFEEASKTYVNLSPDYIDAENMHVVLPDTNELIWWSERSAWGHLYLYDLTTGELHHPLTQGEWLVRNIVHVDVDKRELWIQTTGRVEGRNPYYRDICRVNIDTGELTPVISSDHEYCVERLNYFPNINRPQQSCGIAPGTDYLVATRSRVDQVPVTMLFDRDGQCLLDIEMADVSGLPSAWHWPEPIEVMAADGETPLHGVLFRPSHFCEDQQYPVINLIVSGPWITLAPTGSFHNSRGYSDRYYFQGAALAELGFMVVVIDTRGTTGRGKAFQNTSYGWIPDGSRSDDHRACLVQLAKQYPSMDLNRVGLYCPIGYHGGFQNLFECPDLYKVGVVNNPMDTRITNHTAEHVNKYQGPDGPKEGKSYPEELAHNWYGKLLLIQSMSGGFSDCYPPAATFRVVDALRKANKDFDLIINPRAESFHISAYDQRRVWDYFVEHLLGGVPPKAFTLGEFSA